MTAQHSLPIFTEPDLHKYPRLAFCYAYLREHGETDSRTLGRVWRENGRGSWRFASSEYDKSNGESAGKALAKRGLVRYRNKDGQHSWYPVDARGKALAREAEGVEVDCCAEYPFCGCAA